MKYTISDHLTLGDIKSEEYKQACEYAKTLNEKNLSENLCYKGTLLKIESLEIAKNKGQIVPWITIYTYEFSTMRLISFNVYDSNDNFTVEFNRA